MNTKIRIEGRRWFDKLTMSGAHDSGRTMSQITAIRTGRGRKVRIYLDGRFAFGLEAEAATRQGLRVGQELSEEELNDLTHTNQLQCCLNAAARYLGYRPRSESELRDRLHRRGFDDANVETVINQFKEQGLVDDRAFAEFWKDNRQSFSPRSQRLTGLELRQKGVARDIVEQTVGMVDDADCAYRAALGKARSLPKADYQAFRRRLGGYLKRRGFGYQVIDRTIKRLWQENGTPSVEGASISDIPENNKEDCLGPIFSRKAEGEKKGKQSRSNLKGVKI